MPQALKWTETADAAIRSMRADGRTWEAIGASLGLSRNTVIERGRRLCALAPKRQVQPACVRPASEDPNRAALPAGHPLTWRLLSEEDYPQFQSFRESFAGGRRGDGRAAEGCKDDGPGAAIRATIAAGCAA
jgi:hypothetical protein